MEPRMTETLRYLFIAFLFILASQGIAQDKTSDLSSDTSVTENALYPNTVTAEIAIDQAQTFSNDTQVTEAASTIEELPISIDEITEGVSYFKVKKVVHKTKFAEERLVRKSYIV